MKGRGYAEAKEIDGYMVEYKKFNDANHIYIWGPPINPGYPDNECVHIMQYLYEKDVGILQWLEHHDNCTKHPGMQRKTGTKKMLEFAFELAKDIGVKRIELNDTSKVKCHHIGEDIMLSSMYFLKHGVTWYEKQYGFQPESRFKEEYAIMKRNRLLGLDIAFLKHQSCEYFTPENTRLLLQEIGHKGLFINGSWVKYL